MRRVIVGVLLGALAGFAQAEDNKPSVADLTKGMTASEGFVTVYRQKDKALMLVPRAALGKHCLLAVGMSRGPWTGILWQELMVAFERRGEDKLLVIAPETRFRARRGTPIASSVTRTHGRRILSAVPILAKGPRGGLLVDLKRIVGRDPGGAIAHLGRINNDLTQIQRAAVFPENLEVAVDLVLRRGGGQIPVRVHYSLRMIPDSGYKPRHADDRVGYFLSVARDYSRSHDARTTFKRLIQRWHLVKADPSLAVSPPKRPIVWYIEKTVPWRFRQHVREGILEWNKAFEKLGFSDAIVVRQQVDGGDFDDLQPEDARYNFFRWGTANVGYAFGPSRVNPSTGEILDASVYFDDSVLRYNLATYRKLNTTSRHREDPKLAAFLERHPRLRDELYGPAAKQPGPELPPHHARCCLHAAGKARQLALASLVLSRQRLAKGKSGSLPEPFLGQVIKEYVMHEIGHTLGLRHNFKASAWRPMKDITGKQRVEAISASVMDYNGINFPLAKGEAPNYQMTTLGPYDYWAIRFGYAAPGKDEKATLAAILAESTKPEHAYASDEDRGSLDPDPHTRAWDLGRDPLDFARRSIAVADKQLAQLKEKGLAEGESYAALRPAFATLINERGYSLGMVAAMIGGVHVSRVHKGKNAGVPMRPVKGEEQRAALKLIVDELFDAGKLTINGDLLRHLGAYRWGHWETDQFDEQIVFSYPRAIRRQQLRILLQLFNPTTLRRVEQTPLMAEKGDKPLTMVELFTTVGDAVWSETKGEAKAIGLLRRNLQRLHLDMLVFTMLGDIDGLAGDARTLAWDELRRTGEAIKAKLAQGGLEAMTAAHLREAEARCAAAIKARFDRR